MFPFLLGLLFLSVSAGKWARRIWEGLFQLYPGKNWVVRTRRILCIPEVCHGNHGMVWGGKGPHSIPHLPLSQVDPSPRVQPGLGHFQVIPGNVHKSISRNIHLDTSKGGDSRFVPVLDQSLRGGIFPAGIFLMESGH